MADKTRQRWIKEAWATCRRASRLLIRGTDVYRETSGQNTREIGTRAYFSSVTQSVCAAVHLEPGPDAFELDNSGAKWAEPGQATEHLILSCVATRFFFSDKTTPRKQSKTVARWRKEREISTCLAATYVIYLVSVWKCERWRAQQFSRVFQKRDCMYKVSHKVWASPLVSIKMIEQYFLFHGSILCKFENLSEFGWIVQRLFYIPRQRLKFSHLSRKKEAFPRAKNSLEPQTVEEVSCTFHAPVRRASCFKRIVGERDVIPTAKIWLANASVAWLKMHFAREGFPCPGRGITYARIPISPKRGR